ncbi:hypothetical protein J2S40_004670 [Nocardioides luteus]|nr:hypothetical protein [Nocardioides luteus]
MNSSLPDLIEPHDGPRGGTLLTDEDVDRIGAHVPS